MSFRCVKGKQHREISNQVCHLQDAWQLCSTCSWGAVSCLDTGLPEIDNYLYKIQSKAMRRIKGLENISCEDKFKELEWLSQEGKKTEGKPVWEN